jgi:hypothetical protein
MNSNIRVEIDKDDGKIIKAINQMQSWYWRSCKKSLNIQIDRPNNKESRNY